MEGKPDPRTSLKFGSIFTDRIERNKRRATHARKVDAGHPLLVSFPEAEPQRVKKENTLPRIKKLERRSWSPGARKDVSTIEARRAVGRQPHFAEAFREIQRGDAGWAGRVRQGR